MKLSHTMGVAALAASFGVSGLASAVTIYGTDGFITDSTCGALSSTLAVGAEQVGQLYLQPAGIAGSSTESAATVSTLNGGTPVPGSLNAHGCSICIIDAIRSLQAQTVA